MTGAVSRNAPERPGRPRPAGRDRRDGRHPATVCDPGRAVDARGELLCIARRQDGVALAPQHQGRRLDQAAGAFPGWVLPSGQKARAAASEARAISIGHSIELAPSGRRHQRLPFLGVGAHQAGDVVLALRPRIGRPARPRRTGRTARSARACVTWPGKIAAISAANAPPTEAPTQIGAGEARLVDELAHRQHPVEMRVELGVAGRRRDSPAATARSPCASRRARRGTAPSAAGRRSRRGSRAWGRCPWSRRGRGSRSPRRWSVCGSDKGSTPPRRAAGGRPGRPRAGPWPSAWATTCPPSRRTGPSPCGITFSANSRVLYLVVSLLMLPYCSSSMRWPTLRLVADVADLLDHLVGRADR